MLRFESYLEESGMSPVLPECVGPYRLESPIASAPSGTVWLALDARRRRVAFKLHDDPAQARAEMALLGFQHPSLATCLDANLMPGTSRSFTVTEFVDGVPLGPGALDRSLHDATARAASTVVANIRWRRTGNEGILR